MAKLEEYYHKECVPLLIKEFGYKNIMEVPRLGKIVLNMGLGEAVQNPKIIEGAAAELTAIAGQKAVVTKAKKSIATFKLREGMPIGCRVTLRNVRMYDFYTKLVQLVLPRVRDFRGINPRGFDGNGNFSMGIKEHIIFPEIDYDKIDKIKGFNITITTSAHSDDEGRFLLKALGMPFKK
ncbi:MAG: 50S ribosomal protein L5 [Desulfobulbaceae bacterium]|uniref:Large ribosomal subunit protein uL5 n=1 Tax=Candidatus Desulfobia pelagia TaxID=2841692 RepID=A0A8J6NH46_9BACT|nr:50S ribosomal protein L5 [Candidatus Desulfobia pelagia]